jgi:hypothetical protein
MTRRLLLVLALVLGVAAPALAQRPTRGLTGERLDLVLVVLPDGSVDVSETIRFRFADREFEEVNREIPIGRTDGVIDVTALQDGRVVPEGRGEGTVRVQVRRTLRVRWRFADVTDVARDFTLRYRAMGVLSMANARATLEWAVIPEKRRYAIEQARVELRIPTGAVSLGGPEMVASGWRWSQPEPGVWVAEKANVAIGESAVLRDVFEAASLSAAPPQWQADQERARQLAPAFIIGAVVIVVMGAGVLIMVRIRHGRPAVDMRTVLAAEQTEWPAGIATALRGGRLQLMPTQQAATVFDLAARGVVRLEQREPKAFDVVLPSEAQVRMRLRPHEQVVFDALWLVAKNGRADLKAGRDAVVRGFAAYKKAVDGEARAAGWIDEDRVGTGKGLVSAGVVALLAGVAGAVVLAVWVPWTGELALLVPAALAVMGTVFLIGGAVFPTLSLSGEREAHRWEARRRALKDSVASGVSTRDLERWLPYAMGWHMGPAFIKAADTAGHGAAISWVQGTAGDAAGITALLAATHVSTSSAGVGGVSGGGVAGGGSSGAS